MNIGISIGMGRFDIANISTSDISIKPRIGRSVEKYVHFHKCT